MGTAGWMWLLGDFLKNNFREVNALEICNQPKTGGERGGVFGLVDWGGGFWVGGPLLQNSLSMTKEFFSEGMK